ncbi:hypothetical protein BDV26DRAFT_293357 [Aspergillus bertholletiae]|uniref:Uncharacterized protein n=1 Tax=Aspergillus bertholletiae TaxID=1226010 RepID=A0A5N7B587_9EURO|nr:hypothetical protein BDV26DRAFT_293357 [Aspergillus bertholletiae]
MSTSIYIAVYSSPIAGQDWIKNRHTAIWVTFADGSYTLFGLQGIHGAFRYYERPQINPQVSDRFETLIKVATVADESVSRDRILDQLRRTEINNEPQDTGDYDCRKWVSDALANLGRIGCLTEAEREVAVDAMVDTLLKARDEDSAFPFSIMINYGKGFIDLNWMFNL